MVLLAVGSAQASGYSTVAGDTVAERAAFARESESLARQLAYLAPIPTELMTLGGYVSWRVFGALPLLLGVWVVWLAVSMLRGSEDATRTESLLAAGAKRKVLVRGAAAAFAVTTMGASLGLCLSLWAASSGEIEPSVLLLQAVAVVAVLLFVFGLGSLAAQLGGSRRSAFSIGAATLFVLNLLNSLGSASDTMSGIRRLSPLSWYSASDPMARGGDFSLVGTSALVALALALIALATLAFERRDIGQPLVTAAQWGRRRGAVAPSGVGWYRRRLLGVLYERRVALGWWVGGVLVEVVFFVTLAPGMVASLKQVQQLHEYLTAITNGDIARGIVGLFLIGTIQLLLALFAITAVAGWAHDDASGRLEFELSLPISRSQVVIRRAAFLFTAASGIGLVALLFMFILAGSRGIAFELGRVLLAVVLLAPFTVAFGAVGALWTSWRPQGAVFVLTAVAVTSYFIQEVTPLYGWPDWVLDFSFFHLYGNPLVADPVWWRIALLLMISLAGFAGAAYLSRARDVGH
ncbi:MAG: hypothetical protein M3346_07400 [Actinomycetota bacterium]|nr:hypothetical protein [Actinomycetota bacterium]